MGSFVRQWAWEVHPLTGRSKFLSVLQAYFDESGVHADSPILVVAGYVGGLGQWRKFEKLWRKALDRHCVGEFHAQRFWSRDPTGRRVDIYRDWSDLQADRFLCELLKALQKTKVYPLTSSLVIEDWNHLSKEQRDFLTGGEYSEGRRSSPGAPNKPFFAPFQVCVTDAAEYCGEGGKVHFVFDQSAHIAGYALELYSRLQDMNLKVSHRLGDILFSGSHEAAPLQAADLLAHLTFRHLSQENGAGNAPMDPVLQSALTKTRSLGHHSLLNREGLVLLLKGFSTTTERRV